MVVLHVVFGRFEAEIVDVVVTGVSINVVNVRAFWHRSVVMYPYNAVKSLFTFSMAALKVATTEMIVFAHELLGCV